MEGVREKGEAVSRMKTSWEGIKFICCREALVRVAYLDGKHKDGTPKYSIGFGSQTPTVVFGDTITVEEAFLRQIDHVEANDKVIARRVKVALKQCEWDALASLFYQDGNMACLAVAGLFNEKVSSIWGILEFANWHENNSGLAKRRAKEIALANAGYYDDIATYKYYDGDPKQVQVQERAFPPVQPMR